MSNVPTVPNLAGTSKIKDSQPGTNNRNTVAIWNNYDTCGTMTRADIGVAEAGDLDGIFTSSSALEMGKTTARYRDMESLLTTQMELKTCGGRQYGMYDWLMSSATSMGANLTERKISGGASEIEPFILAAQKDIIKDDYWLVTHIMNFQYKYETHANPTGSGSPTPGSTPSSAVTALAAANPAPAEKQVILRVKAAGNNPNATGYFPKKSTISLFAKGGINSLGVAYRLSFRVDQALTDANATAIDLVCTFLGGWGGGQDLTESDMFGPSGEDDLKEGKVLSLISKYQSPATDVEATGVDIICSISLPISVFFLISSLNKSPVDN